MSIYEITTTEGYKHDIEASNFQEARDNFYRQFSQQKIEYMLFQREA